MANTKWVAVGDYEQSVEWSDTPSGTWSSASIFGDGGSYGIAYGYDTSGIPIWIATGDAGSAESIQYASDPSGIWIPVPAFDTWGWGIAYGKDSSGIPVWAAVGSDSNENNLMWADDPRGTWNPVPLFGTGNGNGIAYGKDSSGKSIWVAVGDDPDGNNIQWASEPSGVWTGIEAFGGGGGYGVAYGKDSTGKSIWVAVGDDPDGNNIQWASEPSGVWTGIEAFVGGGGYGVAYGKDSTGKAVWVAVGNDPDGNNIQWASEPRGPWNPVQAFGDGYFINGVAYGKDSTGKTVWVAVGDDPDGNNIQYASDPRGPWTPVPAFDGNIGYGVAFNRVLGEEEALPCFLQGTRILTPTGYKRVEEIESGDLVLTSDTRSVKAQIYAFTIDSTTEETAPYTIHAGALGPTLPLRDLHVSGHHAIQDAKGVWQFPRFLANKNKQIQQHSLGSRVTYYHVECPRYMTDNLVAEGVTAESLNKKKEKVIWKRTGAGYVRQIQKERTSKWALSLPS